MVLQACFLFAAVILVLGAVNVNLMPNKYREDRLYSGNCWPSNRGPAGKYTIQSALFSRSLIENARHADIKKPGKGRA